MCQTANEMEAMCDTLTIGLHCKACDKGLGVNENDPELCGECMVVVMDYNRDLDHPDKFELEDGDFEYFFDVLDNEDMSLEEYEKTIIAREVSP